MAKAETNKRSMKLAKCFSGGVSGLVFWTFRYFMGRKTIATCGFAEELAKAWPLLDDGVRHLIRKELEEAFMEDDRMREDPVCSANYYPLGNNLDRSYWEQVRAAYRGSDKQDPQP